MTAAANFNGTGANASVPAADPDYLDSDLLRFTTAGSVDDGKSTLIGRLLYDTKSIFEDQYEAIRASSEKRGEEYVNLALLTDGLRAEREQGITIDVAYRYFATPRRKFIIADTPGHIQYTRNMVTGASTADLALILVDARHGVVEQTRRHAIIAGLLRIPHVVLCVNKMDLVDFDQTAFERVKADFETFARRLDIADVRVVPVSALRGDNVADRSEAMPWYSGPALLGLLETMPLVEQGRTSAARFPVQYVIRPQSLEHPDYRGYAGRVAGGTFRVGERVMVLPSGLASTIAGIDTFDGPQTEAPAGQSVTLRLQDDIDISRGDLIASGAEPPHTSQDIDLMVCWLSPRPLTLGGKYAVKHTSRDVRGLVKSVAYKLNVNTGEQVQGDKTIGLNEIARVTLRTTHPLVFDRYAANRTTGSLILIDEGTNETVGAGMIV